MLFKKITRGTLFNVLQRLSQLGVNGFFSIKMKSDGSLARFKVHLIALGNRQEQSIDYDETFALVVKMTNVRTILSIVVAWFQPLQFDVKNSFLHGDLKEEVYMLLPLGYPTAEAGLVARLHCSLYGLKQALRA